MFMWRPTTSLPMDTTTTRDKVEMVRTAGNLRATTTATSTTTKMSTFVVMASTPNLDTIDLGMNEVFDTKEDQQNKDNEEKFLPSQTSAKLSKMKKNFTMQKNLSQDKQSILFPEKKSNKKKKRIVLDPAYSTGCTKKGRVQYLNQYMNIKV